MTGVELATLCLTKSTPPSPPTVEADRIPELVGEIERLRAVLWAQLRCRRGRSVTTKCLSNTPRVSGCTVFGWAASR